MTLRVFRIHMASFHSFFVVLLIAGFLWVIRVVAKFYPVSPQFLLLSFAAIGFATLIPCRLFVGFLTLTSCTDFNPKLPVTGTLVFPVQPQGRSGGCIIFLVLFKERRQRERINGEARVGGRVSKLRQRRRATI